MIKGTRTDKCYANCGNLFVDSETAIILIFCKEVLPSFSSYMHSPYYLHATSCSVVKTCKSYPKRFVISVPCQSGQTLSKLVSNTKYPFSLFVFHF